MSALTVRPSTKTVKVGYVLVVLLIVGFALVWRQVKEDGPAWVPALAVLALIFPIRAHLRRMFTKMTVDGERLRYESGFLSKTTRTMELRRIQDVRVDQNLKQRMLGVGDLSIETAGESGRLVMPGIDDPQRIADVILNASRGGAVR